MKMDKCRRRGFTLIELLVVIAIIAILAAILFPVFMRAKRAAQENTCIYNQKQWGLAMMRYTDDYNGGFPYAGVDNYFPHNLAPKPLGQGGKYRSCPEALLPYVSRNKKILFCPLWKGSEQSKSWPNIDWSYWYFCAHTCQYVARYPKSALCGYKMSDVTAPSRKPFLTEINAPHTQNTNDYTTAAVGQTQVYCDGHAKLVKASWATLWTIGYTGRDGTPPPPP